VKKEDIVEFFDRCAPSWDAEMIKSDEIIGIILDAAGVEVGKTVLDVACGTGVMFPYYLNREVASVTGIDISPEMVKIAREKFPQVQVVCNDVEETAFDRKFDCIVVYNAFPHFPDPERLIEKLTGLLNPGGTLTVAHGMSRARIDHHHEGKASKVSCGLMSEDDLAKIFSNHLTVTTKLSNDHMYQVTGKLL